MAGNESLIQAVLLVVVTAAVSGFGVPYLLGVFENRRLRAQKKLDAALSRQAKLLDAQSELLDDLTRVLWKWRYLAKTVVYYGAREDGARFEKARTAYEEGVWSLLDNFRTDISRSRRLVSEEAFRDLNQLYDYVVHDLDQKVSELLGDSQANREKCASLASRFTDEVSARLDDWLYDLAKELTLTSRSIGP